jgi:hypothetical protein
MEKQCAAPRVAKLLELRPLNGFWHLRGNRKLLGGLQCIRKSHHRLVHYSKRLVRVIRKKHGLFPGFKPGTEPIDANPGFRLAEKQ